MDAVSFHGAPLDLQFNFSSKTYDWNDRKITETIITSKELFIKSPSKKNLHVSANFSATDLAAPTVKVKYCGNDHRSWIDIVVLHNEISGDVSLYFHQTLSVSENSYLISTLSTNINTIPNVKDQVLVFSLGDSYTRTGWKHHFLIHGKSYKKFQLIKKINDREGRFVPINFKLNWNVQFQPIPSSLESLLSLQGESYELGVYIYCNTNKKCQELKIHWVPNQLSNYKDDSHNNPQNCLKEYQMNIPDKIYCLNFSSSSTNHYYVSVSVIKAQIKSSWYIYPNENLPKVSWNDASFLCQHLGGFLPVIRSKSELDEFISLVTFSDYVLPKEKIYIGLYNQTEWQSTDPVAFQMTSLQSF